MWIKFTINGFRVCIGIIYRPPKGNMSRSIDSIDSTWSKILPTFDHIICVGDTNIDLLTNDNPSCFDAYDLYQSITEPTKTKNPYRLSRNNLVTMWITT